MNPVDNLCYAAFQLFKELGDFLVFLCDTHVSNGRAKVRTFLTLAIPAPSFFAKNRVFIHNPMVFKCKNLNEN